MDTSKQLLAVAVDGRYGYANLHGEIVVEPRFDSASDFAERRGPVLLDDAWGYVDETGGMVVEPRFHDARQFSEGLAAVELDEGFGYIDRDGVVVISAGSYEAGDFAGGVARVRESMEDAPVFIDSRGRALTGLAGYELHLSELREGLINVAREGRWGYVDRGGEIVIPLRYAAAGPFGDGLAAVSSGEKTGFAFIDRTGAELLPGPFEGARLRFREGRCAVWRDGAFGFIGTDGRPRGELDFALAEEFHEGLAVVRPLGSERYGYADRQGRLVIADRFDEANDFRFGAAEVGVDGADGERRYGYIDPRGQWIWEPSR